MLPILWTLVAAIGAAGWAMLALHRGETVNAAWLVLAAVGCALSSVDTFALLFFASYMAVGLLLAFRRPEK